MGMKEKENKLLVVMSRRDLRVVLDALDLAIECCGLWEEADNKRERVDKISAEDRREMKLEKARFWGLVTRLIENAPGHYMGWCFDRSGDGASRGDRATGTAREGENGIRGSALKPLTKEGFDGYPPVTVRTSRVGRSTPGKRREGV